MESRFADIARFRQESCAKTASALRRIGNIGSINHGVTGNSRATIYTLIQTAKLNGIDPQAWLADVLARIAETPIQRLDQLLPWNWRASDQAVAA
jgi:hypothetical protein